jgi:hypothetical protein
MEFFEFFRQLLILLITVSLYWPLSIPLAALAYKLRLGGKPIPLSTTAYWVRSGFAALGMAVLCVSLMGSDQVCTLIGLPPGPVHVLMFMVYIPLGSLWMFKIFALEDGWEGLSTLLLYACVPGLFLVLLKLVGLELPHFIDIKSWINPIPVST